MTKLRAVNIPKFVTLSKIFRSTESLNTIAAVRSVEAAKHSSFRSVPLPRLKQDHIWDAFILNPKLERLSTTDQLCLRHSQQRALLDNALYCRHYNASTNQILKRFFHFKYLSTQSQKETSSSPDVSSDPPPEGEKKPSLWKRFKQMYKEYWYVLVPVHIATSIVWFGSFYYLARSGVDIIPLLETLGASDRILAPLKESKAGAEAGYVAITYAMYKIATPARYAVTLGGTTISIGYLKQWGIIKPAPGANELKQMIRTKRSEIQEKIKRQRAARQKRKQQRKRIKNNK